MDLVGAKDIATRAGVQVDTVKKWRVRHPSFPSPLATISGTIPVWEWRTVARWLDARKDGAEQQNRKNGSDSH